MRVVKVRGPPVERVPKRIIPRPRRNGIGANVGHPPAVGQVIDTLRPGVVT